MTAVTASCPARMAIAGNPSDGFGGSVFSVPIDSLRAEVTVTPTDVFRISPGPSPDDEFGSAGELRDHVERHGLGNLRSLLLATVASVATRHDLAPFTITGTTNIPRSVGLAGSSALVIAALRAIEHLHDIEPAPPDELAAEALAVETEWMGIRAGLQDRVVQAYGAPVLMHFDDAHCRVVAGRTVGTYERVVPTGPRTLMVAWREDVAEPSDVAHAQAGRVPTADDAGAFAEAAALAAKSFVEGDTDRLGKAMDRTVALRGRVMSLRPDHLQLVEAARSCGSHANYAGSGGAISVLAGSDDVLASTRDHLIRLGCETIVVEFPG